MITCMEETPIHGLKKHDYTMPPWRHERQETAVMLRKKNLPAAYPVYSTPQRTVQDLRQMNT